MNSILKTKLLFVLLCMHLLIVNAFGKERNAALKKVKTYHGYVTDSSTGEQLIGVSISAVEFGLSTNTNSFGYFSMTLPKERVRLRISHLSYQTIDTVVNYAEKGLNISLKLLTAELSKVEITANAVAVKNSELGKINVPVSQIQALPRFFGEPDLFKALQTLPGVQQGSEATSAILVRGGSADQNLILLDGAPLYNPSHLFGIFSSFNTYAIKNIDLYKGAFPARYGGRLSSVIDVSMNDGNTNRLTGHASIGLIASQLTLSGPIVKQKTSFLFSVRRSYHDLYVAPIVKSSRPSVEKLVFNFYDFNVKLRHKFSERDQLYISGYSGEDNFGSRTNDLDLKTGDRAINSFGLGWQNLIGTLRWNHIFSPKLFSNVTFTSSRYRYAFNQEASMKSQTGNSNDIKKLKSGIVDYSAKLDLSYQPTPSHYLRFGTSIIAHKFIPNATFEKNTFNNQTNLLEDFSNYSIKSRELDVYAEDDWQLDEKLKINLGLHFSGFFTANATYYSAQPRLSLKYQFANDWAFDASYSNMAQYMHLLSSNSISLPTDLWVPATAKIKPQQSNLFSIGVLRTLSDKAISFSVEGYYKTMDNVLEYQDPANLQSSVTNLNWEDKVTTGRGRSYGVELFVQKKKGRLNGWVGYTLGWANRSFPEINGGKVFPYKYDRRHTFNLVSTFKVKEGIELSSSFIFQSASPFTLATTQYERIALDGKRNLTNENIGSRNNIRLQATHRLDVGVNLIKVRKSGTVRTWNFSLYNAYNRKNLFYFETNGRAGNKLNLKGYSILPMLPSISYNLKF